MQVHGLLANDRVEYRAGVFNGAGQNTWSHDGGLQYAGRFMVQPFGEVDYSESDLEFAEAPRLAIAANVETSDGRDDAGDGRQVVLGADVDFRYRGLSLLSEVFFRTRTRGRAHRSLENRADAVSHSAHRHHRVHAERRPGTEEHRPCTTALSLGGEHRITYPAAQRRFAPITMPWSPRSRWRDGLITMGGIAHGGTALPATRLYYRVPHLLVFMAEI